MSETIIVELAWIIANQHTSEEFKLHTFLLACVDESGFACPDLDELDQCMGMPTAEVDLLLQSLQEKNFIRAAGVVGDAGSRTVCWKVAPARVTETGQPCEVS